MIFEISQVQCVLKISLQKTAEKFTSAINFIELVIVLMN